MSHIIISALFFRSFLFSFSANNLLWDQVERHNINQLTLYLPLIRATQIVKYPKIIPSLLITFLLFSLFLLPRRQNRRWTLFVKWLSYISKSGKSPSKNRNTTVSPRDFANNHSRLWCIQLKDQKQSDTHPCSRPNKHLKSSI